MLCIYQDVNLDCAAGLVSTPLCGNDCLFPSKVVPEPPRIKDVSSVDKQRLQFLAGYLNYRMLQF